MSKILVIDIETTGFLPLGKIVEIGAVELDTETGEIQTVFSRVTKPEGITRKEVEESWIVTNGYMSAEEIRLAGPLSWVIREVQALVDRYPAGATAFNNAFDFGFLEKYGVVFPKKLPCPMLLSTDLCKLPSPNGKAGYKWPKVEEAWNYFFGDTGYTELHRGADDAAHEAQIVYELIKRKIFIL